MMNRQELIAYCLTFPAAYEDYPFDSITDAGAWTVMRHKANKILLDDTPLYHYNISGYEPRAGVARSEFLAGE